MRHKNLSHKIQNKLDKIFLERENSAELMGVRQEKLYRSNLANNLIFSIIFVVNETKFLIFSIFYQKQE